MTELEIVPPVRAPADEERVLRDSAVAILRDDRSRWTVRGPKAAEVLNGLVTNDIAALSPGSGCYAAALTSKGKIIADLRVFALVDAFLIETTNAAAPGLAAMLRKYVNPRLARIDDVTDSTFDIIVAGTQAARHIERLFDVAGLPELPAHGHAELTVAGTVHLVARSPEIEEPAFDIIAAADEQPRIYGMLTEAGVLPASLSTWEVARIARGWPVWGRDFDESTLAQEANLDALGAISYTKGCYTGQETVARVHFRGHVNRYLRRGRFTANDEIPRGAELVSGEKVVGEVRSSAVAADIGVSIAMVRREIEASATVMARWNNAQREMNLLD